MVDLLVPTTFLGEPDPPFETRIEGRPLRVLLDSDTLNGPDAELFIELAGASQHVEVCGTEGAPTPSHLYVGPLDAANDALIARVERPDGTANEWAVRGAAGPAAWAEHLIAANRSTQPVETATRALTLAHAARHHFDILVSQDPTFADPEGRAVASQANPRTPTESLPVLGLFMHLHDKVVTAATPITQIMSADFARLVLSHSLTPHGRRWWDGCRNTTEPTIQELASSTRKRLMSVLQARDEIRLERMLVGQGSATHMLYHLDAFLLFFSAAFDTTAEIAGRVHGVANTDFPGWRKRKWRKALGQQNPELARYMAIGQPGGDTLQVLALARNTIHSLALNSVCFSKGSHRAERHLVHLPKTAVPDWWGAASRLGTSDAWGITDEQLPLPDYGGVFFDSGRFVESATTHGFQAIDEIMTPQTALAA